MINSVNLPTDVARRPLCGPQDGNEAKRLMGSLRVSLLCLKIPLLFSSCFVLFWSLCADVDVFAYTHFTPNRIAVIQRSGFI